MTSTLATSESHGVRSQRRRRTHHSLPGRRHTLASLRQPANRRMPLFLLRPLREEAAAVKQALEPDPSARIDTISR